MPALRASAEQDEEKTGVLVNSCYLFTIPKVEVAPCSVQEAKVERNTHARFFYFLLIPSLLAPLAQGGGRFVYYRVSTSALVKENSTPPCPNGGPNTQ